MWPSKIIHLTCDWRMPSSKAGSCRRFGCRLAQLLWQRCASHLPWNCSGTLWVPASGVMSDIPCVTLFPSTRKELCGLWSQQGWSSVTGTFQLASAGNPSTLLGGINTVTPGKTWSVQEIEVALLWDLKRLRKIAFPPSPKANSVNAELCNQAS